MISQPTVSKVAITNPGHIRELRRYLIQGYRVLRIHSVDNDDLAILQRRTPAAIHQFGLWLNFDGTTRKSELMNFWTRL